MAVDLSFLTGGYGDQPLPSGTPADPTYLAFLRGMGMDTQTAWATAIKNVEATKAQYNTDVSRDPQVLADAIRATDANYSSGNAWSGQRIADLAQRRTEDQQRLADFKTAETQGISGAQDTLRSQLEQLARGNVDQIGALQERRDVQTNQDKYIKAVQQASAPAGTGPVDPLTGQPSAAPAPGAPTASPSAQLAALTPAQKDAFRRFTAPKPAPAPLPAAQRPGYVGAGASRT